jgi:hypothetical protein
MGEVLTLEEIESRFEAEWVLIDDPQTDEALEVKGGRVMHHSKDRDEVYRRAAGLKSSRFAVLYTGAPPEDMAIVL